LLTREPTDGPIGKLIREYISTVKVSERDLVYESLLFAADRRWHVINVIKPALEKFDVVISDRYVFSSYVYQQSKDTPLNWLIQINKGVLNPDFAFFLDANPNTCLKRLCKKESRTVFESSELLYIFYARYLEIARQFNLIRIDAERSIDSVVKDIVKVLISTLGKLGKLKSREDAFAKY